MRRNQIAGFLGIILVILTIAIAGSGYFTYKNLNEIVARLETDNRPNDNLLLYKEIMISLTGMENQVEFYQLMEEQNYLDNYNLYIDKVSLYLDSINNMNQEDKDMVAFNDSLTSLIDRKTEILNTLLQLEPDQVSKELSELEKKLDEIPEIVKDNDFSSNTLQDVLSNNELADVEPDQATESPKENVEGKKGGWLKRLFSSKKKEKLPTDTTANKEKLITITNNDAINQDLRDSIMAARAKQYRADLANEIQRIKTSSEYVKKKTRDREMELMTAHFETQNQIIDLISFLESRESLRLELNTLNAKDLANRTNEQIILFTSLATILLLTSVFVMLSYFNKSRKYQNLLRESKKSTENLAKAKEKFFANMSHEIRTPMNAISGFTKILLKSELNPDQREHVQIIYKSADHLIKLLNDILDFSKLQAEKLQLEKVTFDPEELCTDVIKLLRESANSKNLRLTYQFRNLSKAVIGDPYRLRQILLNLLNNGIKYTEKGGVSLIVSAKTSKGKSIMNFKVSDTGIGISKDQLSRLFREFEQADQSSFSKGTGLGLAITKKLVLLHELGKIELKSSEGKGTIVNFSLCYKITDTIPEAPAVEEFTEKINDIRILIADDEPFNVKLLATLFRQHNIDFDEASDGEQAYKLLMGIDYDIILLDLKMPKMSGWEVVKFIKEGNGPNKNKPFIALTATLTKLDQKKGHELGFDHIMKKPFDEKALFEIIAQQTSNTPIRKKTRVHPAVDLSYLHRMGDQKFVDDMVQTFITSATSGIASIEKNLADKNFSQIAIIAHRIVAPARHFKAEKLIKMLKELEKRAEKNDPTITTDFIRAIKKELFLIFDSLRDSLRKEIVK